MYCMNNTMTTKVYKIYANEQYDYPEMRIVVDSPNKDEKLSIAVVMKSNENWQIVYASQSVDDGLLKCFYDNAKNQSHLRFLWEDIY